MDIRVERTNEPAVLGKLNKDVQELHHEIEPGLFKPYNFKDMTGFFSQVLEESKASAFVVYYKDQPAGYVLLMEIDRGETAFRKAHTVLSIDQICVEKSFKGKGLGKVLVDYAKDQAKVRKIRRLEMNYWTQNNNSGEFFRSQGFKTYNERLNFYL